MHFSPETRASQNIRLRREEPGIEEENAGLAPNYGFIVGVIGIEEHINSSAIYLRSENRMGTLPGDKHGLIGFRVVMGPRPLAPPSLPLNQRDVSQAVPPRLRNGPDPGRPYFRGPRKYVKIPPNSFGPLFSTHNHDPDIVACPNGDLLAIWYTCVQEPGRELGLAASRLRYGHDEWDEASPFWNRRTATITPPLSGTTARARSITSRGYRRRAPTARISRW